MAKFVQKDGVLKVDGNDLSSYASTISFNQEKERVDVTGQTAAGFREETDGFSTAEATVTFFMDYLAGTPKTPHQVLYPLFTSGSIFPLRFQPQATGTPGGGSVVWVMGQAKLYNYGSGGAGVGDAASVDVTFSNAGTAGVVATAGTA